MLIGVNGQIGSGKDAFFEIVTLLQGTEGPYNRLPRPERLAFADKLKDAFGNLLGLDRTTIEALKRDDDAVVVVKGPRWNSPGLRTLGPERTYSELTVRLGLQRMGTEVGRDLFGDMFWVDQCIPADFDHSGRLVLVTDTRFPNEAQRIRDVGGYIVRMLNGPLVETGHASEQILPADLIDYEIDNSRRDDNFASLKTQARNTLTSIHDRSVPPAPAPKAKKRSGSRKARKVGATTKVRETPPKWTKEPAAVEDVQ